MIDEPSEWHMAIGAAMPTVPYSNDSWTGLPFVCSWDFFYTQLRKAGYDDEQIAAYTEYLRSLPPDEPFEREVDWSAIKPDDFQVFDSSKGGDNGQG